MGATSAGAWVLLPQAVSRLSALFVFAVAANRLDIRELGVLAIGTAATAAAFGVVPAVVGKPLAALTDAGARAERGRLAESAAVLLSLPVGVVLALAALATDDLLRTTLAACAIGIPAAAVVEAHYWRSVFVDGRKRAGVVLSAAFVVQAAAVTVAALWLDATAVMLAPFVGLAVAAVVVIARSRSLTLHGARTWLTVHRQTWLPFVWGVSASVLLVQAVPLVLTLAAGLEAASVYRAAELLFGATNLAIGVVTRALLTEDAVGRPRAVWVRTVLPLALLAAANGAALLLVPADWLQVAVGPVTEQLTGLVVGLFTVQRVGLAAGYVAVTLLLRLISARRVGTLEVLNALAHLVLLTGGAATLGLAGGIAGLTVAEVVSAAYFLDLLVRAARPDDARGEGSGKPGDA